MTFATGGSQWLWFISRGSGLVLLVALSSVVALGVATRLGSSPGRLPLFVVAELHRTLSLFGVALLALHVTTALLDPFVSIGWIASVVPFVSHYKAVAIGLGALAVDLLGAVLITSLLRHRLGYRTWRGLHWFAYIAWPIAVVHAFQAGTDFRIWWAAALEWGAVGMVATAVAARLLGRFRSPGSQRFERARSRGAAA